MTEVAEESIDVSEHPPSGTTQGNPRTPPFSLFSLFKRAPKMTGLTGVGITSDGICIVHVDKTGGTSTLEVCDYKPCFSREERPGVLNALVATHGLKHARCTLVMDPGNYSLHLVDAPNVEASEMRSAIRWRVKELVDFPIEEAAIDVFDIPGRNLRGQGGRMIYVVVAHTAEIKKRIALIEGAGLKLDIIDIPELALRNVAAMLPEDEDGVATLHLTQHSGLITLTRQGTLYLARSINIGIDRLLRLRLQGGAASEGEQSPALTNALDSVVLEIQRSLDYYERHCSNPPISQLVVTPVDDEIPGFLDYIAGSLSVEVKALQLSDELQSFMHVRENMLRNCLPTIGAALRYE